MREIVQKDLKCPCFCSRHLNEKPKLITDKLFLIYKFIPNSQTQENPYFPSHKFPQKQGTFIKHITYQNVEKPRHKNLSMIQAYQKISILNCSLKYSS